MGLYVDRCNKILNDFYIRDAYDYSDEFGNREPYNGTYMPLSAITYSMTVYHRLYNGGAEPWEWYYADEEADYVLNEAGKILYDKLKVLGTPEKFERSRIGSVAMNAYAMNYRRRQIYRLEKYRNEYDLFGRYDRRGQTYLSLEALRKFSLEHLEAEKDIFMNYLFNLKTEIDTLILDRDRERIRRNIEHYIADQRKQKVSIMPGLKLNYPYLLRNEDPVDIAQAHSDILELTMKEPYGEKRVNYKILLNPLRNKPASIKLLNLNKFYGRMSQSRKPVGEPHFSHVKICIYDKRKEFDVQMAHEMEDLWKIKAFDPYNNEEFMFDYLRGRKGRYIFGDNGSNVISNTEKYNYDVSMSEVIVAYLTRSNEGENYSYYLRLNHKFDTGGSGDPITWGWNINNQRKILKAWDEGLISGDYIPYIPDVLEQSTTFLAMYQVPEGYHINLGMRLSRDSSRYMKSYQYRLGLNTLTWPIQYQIDEIRFMQTLITLGIVDVTIDRFYEWAHRKHISSKGLDIEEYTLLDTFSNIIKGKEKEFIELFEGIDIEMLAKPMIVIPSQILNYNEPDIEGW